MVSEKTKRDEFIKNNLGLVHSLCRRFTDRGIEYDDLFQAGSLGLIKAVNNFEEDRGLCFSTYAFPVVLGEIRRLFRDGGAVKVSRSLKELGVKISKQREMLELSLGREPTVSEIAVSLSVSAEEVAEAISANQVTVSLTYEGDEGISEIDLPTEDTTDYLNNRIVLSSAFSSLEDTEKRLVLLRYFESLTQSETAAKMGMTQVQVSRKEKKILSKLRNIIGEI